MKQYIIEFIKISVDTFSKGKLEVVDTFQTAAPNKYDAILNAKLHFNTIASSDYRYKIVQEQLIAEHIY
jgi:hypothetical protein